MAHKKNKSKRKTQLSAGELKSQIAKLFINDHKARLGVKDIVRKLPIANSSDAVQSALDSLKEEGVIYPLARGNRYRIDRFYQQRLVENDRNGQGQSERNNRDNRKKGSNWQMTTGTVDPTRSGAAYIVPDDAELDRDVFVPQGALEGALKGDLVQLKWRLSRRGKPEGRVVKILKRNRETFIGTLVVSKRFCFVIPDENTVPMDIIVDRNSLMEGQSDDKVVVHITEWPKPNSNDNPKGVITTVLGKAGGNDIEMKSILIKQGFELDFPEEVMAESEAIPLEIPESEIQKRLDLRQIPTFTIDPATAKDFDDALSVEMLDNGNYRIGIHIADVTYYVAKGSPLDKEAAKRTTSVYLVDRVLPMLPEKLSNGVCSLRPHEDKLTFSALFELNAKGHVVEEWFGKTVIHSDQRFAYEEAQEILDGAEGPYSQELRILNRYAHILRKARFKKGAISFESPEVRFKLDEDGKPVDVYLKHRKDAHMLVEDFMLLANRRVGAKIMNIYRNGGKEIPFVYRIHDLPDMEKVNGFGKFAAQLGYRLKIQDVDQVAGAFNKMLKAAEGKPEHAVLHQLGIRTMSKAAYSTQNIGHYGLGFEDYSHFTSPIRRYADVLVHRNLQHFLMNEKPPYTSEKLEEICGHISKKERNAMDAERESIKYKQTEYLQGRLGQVFQGHITGMTEYGIFVALDENFCEGMLRFENMYDQFVLEDDRFHIHSSSERFKMGDPIWVRVASTNLEKRQVDFQMVRAEEAIAELNLSEEDLRPKLEEGKNEVVEIEAVRRTDLDELYVRLAETFGSSDICQENAEAERNWTYQLASSTIHRKGTVLLQYAWLAEEGQEYPAQMTAPDGEIDQEKWAKIMPELKAYIPNFSLDQLTDTAYCPFYTDKETNISTADLMRCQAFFFDWMSYLQAEQVLCFSARLKNYLVKNGLIRGLEELTVTSGKREIRIFRGYMPLANKKLRFAFFPSLSTSYNKKAKKEAWTWALEKP